MIIDILFDEAGVVGNVIPLVFSATSTFELVCWVLQAAAVESPLLLVSWSLCELPLLEHVSLSVP